MASAFKTVSKAESTYRSRKFVLTILGLTLVAGLAIVGLWFPTVPAVYPTFIGGVLGVLSLYFTGNVMHKFVTNKGESDLAKAQQPASQSEYEEGEA